MAAASMSLDLYRAHSQRREPADLPVVQVNIRIHPTVTTIRLVPISKLKHSTLQHHGSPLWLNSLPRPHQLSPRNPRAPRFFRGRPATLQICGCGSKINADHAHFIRPRRASQSRIRRIMPASSISTKARRDGLNLRFLAHTSAASKFWRVRHPRHS